MYQRTLKYDCIPSTVTFIDAEEFLKEIQREEAAKAAQLKAEIKEEQLRLLEEEKLKAKKKTTKKKKKKTKAKSSA